jgi:hypothetical protein
MVLIQNPLRGFSSNLSDGYSEDLSSSRQPKSNSLVEEKVGEPSSNFDLKLVHFVRDIFHQASDPMVVFPMLLASPIYNLGKAGLLRSFLSKPAASWLGRSLTLKALPMLGGFGAETVAFSLSSRALTHFFRGPVPWDPANIIHETAMTGISLAVLKGAGFAGRKFVQWARGLNEFQPQLWTKSDHRALFWTGQVSGYLGLVASHGLQGQIFPHSHASGGNIWLDALGTHIALGIGASGGRALLGSKFHALEQGLAQQAHRLTQEIQFPFTDPKVRDLAFAVGNPAAVDAKKNLEPIPNSPVLVKMDARGTGGKDPLTVPSGFQNPQGSEPVLQAFGSLVGLFQQSHRLDPATGEIKMIDPTAAQSLQRRFDALAEEAMHDPVKAQAYNQPAFFQFYYLTHPELSGTWKAHLFRFFQGETTAIEFMNSIFKESFSLIKAQPERHWVQTQIVATALLRSLKREEFDRVLLQLAGEENLRATFVPYLLQGITEENQIESRLQPLEGLFTSMFVPLHIVKEMLIEIESGKLTQDEYHRHLAFTEIKVPLPKLVKTGPKIATLMVDPFYKASSRHLGPALLERFYQDYARLSPEEKISLPSLKHQAMLEAALEGRLGGFPPFPPEEINRFRSQAAPEILPPQRSKPIVWEEIQNLEKPMELRLTDLPVSVRNFAKQIRFSGPISAHLKLEQGESLWDFIQKYVQTVFFTPKLDISDEGEAGTAFPLVQSVAFATSIAKMELLEFLPVLAHEAYHLFFDAHIAQWNRRMRTAKTLHERNAYLFQAEVGKELIRYLLKNGVVIQKKLHQHMLADALGSRMAGSSNNKYLGYDPADNTLRGDLSPTLSDEILGIYPEVNLLKNWALHQRFIRELGEELGLAPELLQEFFGPLMGPRWKFMIRGPWAKFQGWWKKK